MSRDPFLNKIEDALLRKLDPLLFEECVIDLLHDEFSSIVPVSGSADGGMDGAIADDLPLVRLAYFLISFFRLATQRGLMTGDHKHICAATLQPVKLRLVPRGAGDISQCVHRHIIGHVVCAVEAELTCRRKTKARVVLGVTEDDDGAVSIIAEYVQSVTHELSADTASLLSG